MLYFLFREEIKKNDKAWCAPSCVVSALAFRALSLSNGKK